MDQVVKIQHEGHEKRVRAEAELAKIKNELKAKFLEARDAS